MFDMFKKKKADYTKFNVPGEMGRDKTRLVSFITIEWAVVFSLFAIVTIFFLFLAMFGTPVFLFPVVMIALVWAVVAGTADRIDDTKTVLSYFFRRYMGRTVIAKYKLPDEVILKHFPVEHVRDGGIIEYNTGKHYGVMLRMDPPRTTDETGINTALESVFNSLIPGDMLKIMACSRLNTYKPYSNDILTAANQEGATDEQRKHLHSIYQMVEKNDNETVEWQFNAVLIFEADDVEDAEIVAETRLPGMRALFNNAGVGAHRVYDVFDIQLCLYQQLQREVIRV
jgi:hypothetical protein